MQNVKLFGMNVEKISDDAVFIACTNKNGDTDALRLLADDTADFNTTNQEARIPLIVATRNTHAKTVEFLLTQSLMRCQ